MSKNKEKHHAHEDADDGPDNEDDGRQPARNATPSVAGGTAAGDGAAPAGGPDQDKKLAQLQDRLLRLQADFDNFRKRTLREKNELFDSANQALMLELLPVLDHLHLGIQAASVHEVGPDFREGLVLIFDQLMGALSKFGLSLIATEKQIFDPNRHEAVNVMPSAAEPEGTVLALVRGGYMLRNKLLRPAQVIVSSGPPPEKKTDDSPGRSAPAEPGRRQTTDDGQEKTQNGFQRADDGKK